MTIEEFVKMALETSLYVRPRKPGLIRDELHEIGSRLDIGRGEIDDILKRKPSDFPSKGSLFLVHKNTSGFIKTPFNQTFPDDPKDPCIAEFIRQELIELAKEVGTNSALMPIATLEARGEVEGYSQDSVHLVIQALVISERLVQEGDCVGPVKGLVERQHPGFISAAENGHTYPRPGFHQIWEMAKEVLAKSEEGWSLHIEPTQKFADLIGKLGHDRKVKVWWLHTLRELNLANPKQQTTTCLVLSAALAEAALMLIREPARKTGLTMTSRSLESPRPRFDDLANGAKVGERPIIDGDESFADELKELNQRRQVIHIGRVLDYPDQHPTPDVRPEEARKARATLDKLLRKILDWHELT